MSNHNPFNNLSSEKQIVNDENRSFFLERTENGFISTTTTDVDDVAIQQASPYAFHIVNESLEFHRDLYTVDNNDEDDGNLRDQIRGN
jgi:hypothetical protein